MLKIEPQPQADSVFDYKLILKISLLFLLLGRSWQHLFWDAPFRVILWNEALLKAPVEFLTSMTWHQYATSKSLDQFIQYFIKGMGLFYGVGLFIVVLIRGDYKKKWQGVYLLLVFMNLLFLAFLGFMEKFFYVGMLFEYMAQVSVPLLVYFAFFREDLLFKYLPLFKLCLALTFVGHGLFAIGYYPVPGHFVDMIVTVIGLTEGQSKVLLKVMGLLDIVAALFLFIRPLLFKALYFMVFWGGVTALARVLAHLDLDQFVFTSHQWVLETLVRVPHALVPLAFIFLERHMKKRPSRKADSLRNA